MNLLQLVLKQMRQRALSTWLTLFSVLLGVSLAIAIMVLQRESGNLFAQKDFGYDILVGPPKGSPLQLTLNTVYHMDQSPGVIPYAIYADMARKAPPLAGHPDYRPYVRNAAPFMVGDSYQGRRIVGTSPQMFGFDNEGNPVAGYDAMGQPKEGFADWHLDEEKRPAGMPVRTTTMEYRLGRKYELAEGRMFGSRKFEAVIGAEVAKDLHLHLYDPKLSDEENEKNGGAFRATHGMPVGNEKPDIHKPKWRVVGILKPTHTANDRVLFVPVISLYAIAEHEGGMIDQMLMRANIDPSRVPPGKLEEVLTKLGVDSSRVPETMKRKFKMKAATSTKSTGELMESTAPAPATEPAEDPDAYHLDEKGDIVPDLPEGEWEISAIMVQSRGGLQAQQIIYNFKVVDDRATAVNPALVMRGFFETFLAPSTKVLLLISVFVTVVAAVSIMTTIYNSVSARLREIAILRALGATRVRILSLICLEAVLVGLIGGVLGAVVGHLLSAVGSYYLAQSVGEGINWMAFDRWEGLYLVCVVVLSFLAGLVPAAKAYSTPVATNLVAV